jgi:hypothetical protein
MLTKLTPLQAEVLDHSSQVFAEIGDLTLSALLNGLIDGQQLDPGVVAVNVLRVAANVANTETVTIGNDVYEVHTVNTDTTVVVSGGELNNTATPATETLTAHGLAVGALIRVESEIMRVIGVRDDDTIVVSRGHSGTTVATHANGTSIYKAGAGFTAGRIPVGNDGTLTPAAFSPALVAQINAYGTEPVEATKIGDNEVLLTSNAAVAQITACTETLGGSNNAFAAAAMFGGRTPAQARLCIVSRVPTAAEVALGNMHFAFDFAPTVVAVLARVTATPAIAKATDCTVTVTGNVVKLHNAGGTDWAATDTITLVVTG